ncbi:MAG TPA: endonuclease domain-containing protein [Chitinophagaceae bacterium]|jgi:cyclase|nr:endonuclease domain-containing protein [Chitinophagaceae bacterium]
MKRKMFYGANKIIFENARVLRNKLTNEEMVLWVRLKEHFPNFKFRRQHPISNYTVDFYCHKLKLVIEVDGSVHNLEESRILDEIRQKNLENLEMKVFRFTNEEVRNQIETVLEKINQFIKMEFINLRTEDISNR